MEDYALTKLRKRVLLSLPTPRLNRYRVVSLPRVLLQEIDFSCRTK